MTNSGPLFITDTYVNETPTAEQLAEIAWMSVQEIQRFGLPAPGGVPVALQLLVRHAVRRPAKCARHATCSWPPTPRSNATANCTAIRTVTRNSSLTLTDSTLSGSANLLVCPNLDSANILYNVLKTTTSGWRDRRPVLMGA